MVSKNHKEKTYDQGIKAEKTAARYLALKGYKILEQRYKTPYGEIDLIAQKKDLVAFIEVKARKTNRDALESITPKMKKRISDAALYYISHNSDNNCGENRDYRFDLMTVTPPFFVHHLDNAWIMDT